MTVDVDFLEKRVDELEKAIENLNRLVSGSVSAAQLSSLHAYRQKQINDLATQVDTLQQIIDNLISQP